MERYLIRYDSKPGCHYELGSPQYRRHGASCSSNRNAAARMDKREADRFMIAPYNDRSWARSVEEA
jgi:hypothetical protein